MKKIVVIILALSVLSSCSASPGSEKKLDGLSFNPSAPITNCTTINKTWEKILLEEETRAFGVQMRPFLLGQQCEQENGLVALTAVLSKEDSFADVSGLYLFDKNKNLVQYVNGFETHGGDIGLCEMLRIQDGYLFFYCNSSDGGGSLITYDIYRMSDGKQARLLEINSELDPATDYTKTKTSIRKDTQLCESANFPCDELLNSKSSN